MSTPISQIRTMSAITQPGPLSMPSYDPNPPGPMSSMPQMGGMQQQQQQGGMPDFTNMPPMSGGMGDMGSSQAQQPPNQLVEDILREFEEPPGGNYQQDISAAGMSYAMDPVHIPPPKNPHAVQQLQAEETRIPSAVTSGTVNLSSDGSNHSSSSSIGTFGKFTWLVDALKPLLAVFVIVFLLSLHQVNRYIFTMFPQLLLENGQLSVYGILLRAMIATVLFYLATTFI
jgi:hypothetical protein